VLLAFYFYIAFHFLYSLFFLFFFVNLHRSMRQLAAILFADMAGYTALMQENEQLARLKRNRVKDCA
jgi:hypothetical protein